MRRGVVGLVVVLAILVGWLLWGHDHENVTTSASEHGSAVELGAIAKVDPLARFKWLAQRGVGARRVAGVVLLDGAPVAGAIVRLASKAARAGMIAEPKLVTDASGHFDFGAQLAMPYVVSAESPHVTAAVLYVDLRDPTRNSDALELDLEPCDASAHGTIHDNAGGVIAGARVARLEGAIATEVAATADERGSYELCLPLGDSELVVKAQGYADAWGALTALGKVRRDFTLAPEAIVAGRVVRASDQAPIEGALVQVQGEGQVAKFTASDATGHFSAGGVMPGDVSITATADILRSLAPVHANVAVSSHDEVLVPLRPTLSISGRVAQHGSDVGVGGLEVVVYPASWYAQFATKATTQASGEFTIDGVVTGDYKARVGNKQSDQTLHVGASDLTGVRFDVDPAGSVAGRITFGGKPVEGAIVSASQSTGTTDHDGRYLLNRLSEGKFAIYAESKRVGAFGNGALFTLASGEHKTGVDLDLPLSGSIAGTVVDQNNAPLPGAVLQFELAHGQDNGTATTADDGTFLATELSGGGEYVFQVKPNDRFGRGVFKAVKQRIAVKDGTTHVTGVRIVARVERLSIAGRVVDASNQPMPDLTVSAVRDSDSGSSVTDANGAFEVHDLSTGSYSLFTNAAGGDASTELVAAGRTDVVLHVAEPSGIDGTLEQFTDPFEVVAQGPRANGYGTISGNTFRIRDIPAGKYTVTVTALANTGTADVVVTADAIARVTIRPSGFGSISGNVIDDKQHPVANAYCGGATRNSSTPPAQATSDAAGTFRFDRAPTGEVHVWCNVGNDYGASQVTLNEGQSATVTVAIAATPTKHRGHAGLTVEEHFAEVVVDTVEAGGAADRAGIVAGDVIVSVDDRPMYYQAVETIETRAAGTAAKVGIERGDKQLTLSITID